MRTRLVACLAGALLAQACSEAREATRVQIPVVAAPMTRGPVETNLGYRVELDRAQLVFENLQFAVGGEIEEAGLGRQLAEWLVPSAQAHPGHFSGGDVTGELPGRFVASWGEGAASPLGVATLLAGRYESASFTFARAGASDGLSPGDALFGHTARLSGRATRQGESTAFVALLDSPEARQLTGVPFELEVDASTRGDIALELLALDPYEADTLFDDIEFAELPAAGEGPLTLVPTPDDARMVDAYNTLRRSFQTHDHYALALRN